MCLYSAAMNDSINALSTRSDNSASFTELGSDVSPKEKSN